MNTDSPRHIIVQFHHPEIERKCWVFPGRKKKTRFLQRAKNQNGIGLCNNKMIEDSG